MRRFLSSFVSNTVLQGLIFLSVAQPLASLERRLVDASNIWAQTARSCPRVDSSIPAEIAKQITVRVFTNPAAGSGVIVGRSGQTYIVLTNRHVVADSVNHKYTIFTADGLTHPAQLLPVQSKSLDLALVQFTSKKVYLSAVIGDSTRLSLGEPVYAAGFPNWHYINANTINNTRNWGLRAFQLTTGNVGMLLERSLLRGYQLGYTNEVVDGMSGGPVLDRHGRLVGVNGRLKYPFQGISAFTFTDSTIPSPNLFRQMESLSWAIPSVAFQRMIE